MLLEDYLIIKGMSQKEFADKATEKSGTKVWQSQISSVIKRGTWDLRLAEAIYLGSDKRVAILELKPQEAKKPRPKRKSKKLRRVA